MILEGNTIGSVNDVMWLPNYDAYIVKNEIKRVHHTNYT